MDAVGSCCGFSCARAVVCRGGNAAAQYFWSVSILITNNLFQDASWKSLAFLLFIWAEKPGLGFLLLWLFFKSIYSSIFNHFTHYARCTVNESRFSEILCQHTSVKNALQFSFVMLKSFAWLLLFTLKKKNKWRMDMSLPYPLIS